MIIVHLTPANQNYEAVFVNRFGKTIAKEIVADQSEAKRRMYFYNRNYIVDTMSHYLKQRYWAIGFNQTAVILHAMITDRKFASFYALCKAIAKNTDTFNRIKPSEKSKYYNHYCTHIQPIIDYCNGIEDTGD